MNGRKKQTFLQVTRNTQILMLNKYKMLFSKQKIMDNCSWEQMQNNLNIIFTGDGLLIFTTSTSSIINTNKQKQQLQPQFAAFSYIF